MHQCKMFLSVSDQRAFFRSEHTDHFDYFVCISKSVLMQHLMYFPSSFILFLKHIAVTSLVSRVLPWLLMSFAVMVLGMDAPRH